MSLKKKVVYSLFLIILLFSAFFRLFRLHDLLGFWYDQGRDALVIWDFLHYRKFFLIGPVTGIEGIFLGPFYYYLLAPFYWLGKGSPVFVAAGLSWLTVGAIALIFWLANKLYGSKAALLAAFFYGFSYNQVVFSRWLANPNPLPFFTMLVLVSLYFFLKGKKAGLPVAVFFVGLCLQLEAASAFWFLPTMGCFFIWQRKNLNFKIVLLSFFSFSITLLPQIVFDLRHQGVLRNAFHQFIVAEKSFNGGSMLDRFKLYYDVFFDKLFVSWPMMKLASLALFSASLVFFRSRIFSSEGKLLFLWILAPLVGFCFYRGNHGYIWDYYFTGFIPAFLILFSGGLSQLWSKGLIFKALLTFYLFAFLFNNLSATKNYLKSGIGITLKAQLWALDWIYKDVGKEDFNVDFYVPPQIFYSYSYLLKWYGQSRHGREPETELVKNLYTLYEPDGEHPQFLADWLKRQATIGKILKSDNWGDITVQKRERIKFND